MRRGLERRVRTIEARRYMHGRAAELLEDFDADVALLTNAELVRRILALQANADAYKSFPTAYQLFDETLLDMLTAEELRWIISELETRQAESDALRKRARDQTHSQTVDPVVGGPPSTEQT